MRGGGHNPGPRQVGQERAARPVAARPLGTSGKSSLDEPGMIAALSAPKVRGR